MSKKKILLVFGTRPEAIKMAPLVQNLKKEADRFETVVAVTGQHREMLDQVLNIFSITPDYDLNIMQKGQNLTDVTTKVLIGMRDILGQVNPDVVLVHGDTTTSMAAALAAYYRQIPVGHVEAGLRTYNIYSPWPEEINRQITGRIASFNFAPTPKSGQNLEKEGVDRSKIFITGNTVIDALHIITDNINCSVEFREEIDCKLNKAGYDVGRVPKGRRMVLITGHRRENFGEGFISICRAIKHLAEQFSDVDFVYPMHLNPNVRKPIEKVFGPNKTHDNLFFIEPLDYIEFVRMMQLSTLVLTDSGGIQEEAPGLGKPVLVMRDTTERPEAVEAGTARLVGTNYDKIVNEVSLLLTDYHAYKEMANAANPFGDGRASLLIIDALKDSLSA